MKVKYSALHQMQRPGVNAKAWFYGQSFHGNADGGKFTTCECARVLLWQKVDDYWKAVCSCGRVYLEPEVK